MPNLNLNAENLQIKLTTDDYKIIVKQPQYPVHTVYATNLIGSGATTTSNVSGTDWIIYSPDFAPDILALSGCCSGNTASLTDLWDYTTGFTANYIPIIDANTACCTGNTADILQLNNDLTGLTSSFTSHTGDTTIHFPFSDVTAAISAATSGLTSSWSGLTGSPTDNADLNAILTGITADINTAQACCTGLTETFIDYTGTTEVTLSGLTWGGIVLQSQVNDLEAAFTGHTGDTSIHFTMDVVDLAISAATSGLTSSWSGLTGLPTDNSDLVDLLSGYSLTSHTHTQYVTNTTFDIYTGDTYAEITGLTWAGIVLQAQVNDLETAFTGHTGNTDIHFLMSEITGFTSSDSFDNHTGNTDIHYPMSGISITESQISDLGNYALESDLTGLTSSFNSHTGNTAIHFTGHTFTQSGITVITQVGDNVNIFVPADAITGVTWGSITGTLSGQTDLQAALDLKLDNSVYQGDMLIIAGEIDNLTSGLTTHTGDTSIHYAQSAITITESQISDLQDYALQSDFTGHTSDLTIHYPQSGISITESQISDLQAYTLTGTTAALQSAINTYTGTTAPNTYVNVAGDTMTGALEINDNGTTGTTANWLRLNSANKNWLVGGEEVGRIDFWVTDVSAAGVHTGAQIAILNALAGQTTPRCDMVFKTGFNEEATERMRIDYLGNVKIGTLTASRAIVTDASQNLTESTTTATEIGYVNGVTSAIQTQIDSKVAKAGDTMTGDLKIINNADLYITGNTSYIQTCPHVSDTKLGVEAFDANFTGATHNNTAIGYRALTANVSGRDNIAVGYAALFASTSNSYNTVVGNLALSKLTAASNAGDVAIGFCSMENVTSAYESVGVGTYALRNLTTGIRNVGIGHSAVYNAAALPYNVGVGYLALSNPSTGSGGNTAIGALAGTYYGAAGTNAMTGTSYGVYIGNTARGSAVAGSTNEIVIGYNALGKGSNTVTLGNDSVTGTYLKGTVYSAGDIKIATNSDIYVTGQTSYIYTHASNLNTKLGVLAFDSFTGATHENTAIGYQALTANLSGAYNTAVGSQAALKVTNGAGNTIIGRAAGFSLTTGANNVTVGATSLYNAPAAANCVAIGYNAARLRGSGSNTLTGVTNSVYLGYQTRASANGNTNETVIGYDALGNGSNTVTLGNDSVTDTYLKGAVIAPAVKIVSLSTATTLDATYAGKTIECNGTFTVTFPNSMATGMKVDIVNVGTGTITLAASTTLQSKNSKTKLETQYGGASVYHRGSNVWLAVGDLT